MASDRDSPLIEAFWRQVIPEQPVLNPPEQEHHPPERERGENPCWSRPVLVSQNRLSITFPPIHRTLYIGQEIAVSTRFVKMGA